MNVSNNPGQGLPMKRDKVQVFGPDGRIEEIEIKKRVDICIDISDKQIDEIVETVINKLKNGDMDTEPEYGVKSIKINLPFLNTGGASLGGDLTFSIIPKIEDQLVVLLNRVDDVSAGTISGDRIYFTNGIDDSFKAELRKIVQDLVNTASKILAERASRRTGYNEFTAQQGLRGQSDSPGNN